MTQPPAFSVEFFGQMTIRGPTGQRLDLKSMRGQALIGVLALSRGLVKDRRLLEDLLWPDKPAAAAQTNLRQEVARLRKLFETPDILISDAGSLRLNPALLDFDMAAQKAANARAALPAEFLEGVDVPGPFEDWIRDARAAMSPEIDASLPRETDTTARVPRLQVLTSGEENALAPGLFLDRLVRSLTEIGPIDVELCAADTPSHQTADVRLEHMFAETGDDTILRHAAYVPGEERLGWTAEWRGSKDQLWDARILRQGYLAQQAVLTLLAQSGASNRLATAGLQAILDAFSLDAPRMAEAARQLQAVHAAHPHPAFLAWRAFLLTNQIVERQVRDTDGTADEARDLIWRALEAGSGNSTVLAIAAHVLRILDNDAELAAEFGQDATRINPANPLAWSSAANALISLKQVAQARPLAARALQIGRNAPFRFWWEMNSAAAEVMAGNCDKGLRHARIAHRLKPAFRPPLRYLTALHLADRDFEKAEAAMEKLRALEPDFELRLFREPEYPVHTLRHSVAFDTIKHLAN